jgi:hypothetical protein
MKEFTREILEGLQGGNATPRLQAILDRLNEFGFKDPDIEAIMDVLTARLDPNRAKFSIGPRVIEFADRDTKRTQDIDANILLTSIEGEIETRCAKANFKVSDEYYQKFFESVPAGRMGTARGWLPMGFQHIFTTNYDLCIDKYLRKHVCDNGFVDSGYGRVFTGEWPEGNDRWTLCKLHGSIDWYEVEGRVTQLVVVPSESLYAEKIEGRRMVYPASEKYALSSPYAECLFYLRQRLRTEQFCLVVGYSFRDAPINNAFVDALKFNDRLRIFLLAPKAEAQVKETGEPLSQKVIPISAAFGTDEALTAIRQVQ